MLSGTHLTETIGITFLRHILDEFLYMIFAFRFCLEQQSSLVGHKPFHSEPPEEAEFTCRLQL